MRIRAGKNKLLIPLTIVTIIIWGVIIYNVIEYYNSFDNNSAEVIEVTDDLEKLNVDAAADDELKNIDYIKIERDPFEFVKRSIEHTPKQIKPTLNSKSKNLQSTNNNPAPILKYSINGVLINKDNKLVVFEDITNNKVLFLRENDNYLHITIKEINESKISLIENGSQKEISIKK